MKLIFLTILMITGLISYSCKDDSTNSSTQKEVKHQKTAKVSNIKNNQKVQLKLTYLRSGVIIGEK